MMDDDKIEIIDLEDNKIDNNIDKKEVKGGTVSTGKTKKRHLKKGLIQNVFCIVSFLFIVGCCVFYGNRLIKYYKIYNPKTSSGEAIELISNAILKNTEIVFEGSGLYRTNGLYVYKGDATNNYIKYANMMWRILRTNVDGSLEIILDDSINALAWDVKTKNYVDSDIHKYLNDVILSKLFK